MDIFTILFFLLIGLEYVGITFDYQSLLIGNSGIVLGVVALVSWLQKL